MSEQPVDLSGLIVRIITTERDLKDLREYVNTFLPAREYLIRQEAIKEQFDHISQELEALHHEIEAFRESAKLDRQQLQKALEARQVWLYSTVIGILILVVIALLTALLAHLRF